MSVQHFCTGGNMHHRAKIPFELVEKARDYYESTGSVTKAQSMMYKLHNLYIERNTLKDWCYFKTRVNK